MLGIENLKKLVKFGLDVANKIATDLQDGKITTMEIFGFIPELTEIPDVVKSWPDIAAELKEVSAEERVELLDYIKQNFDIPDDQLESVIEDSLMNVVSLISLVEKFKALKAKP